ncbi:MAG: hypothetical protein ACOC32_00825 [Nanoarchaeota archaeon]
MTDPLNTNVIQDLFFEQIKRLSQQNIMRTIDTFNTQFNGRCQL